MNNRWTGLLWSVTLGLCLGCESAPEGPARYPVAGQVTFQGAPVTQTRIRFENDTGSISTWAELNAEGRYDIRTQAGPGLPAGTYKITLLPVRATTLPDGTPLLAGMEGDPNKEPDHPQIAQKYTDPTTSGLRITLPPSDPKPFDFTLEK